MAGVSGFLHKFPEIKMDESKKKVFLIYVAALLVIITAYSYLLLRPSVSRLTDLIPKLRSRRAEIQAVRTDLPLEDKLKEKNRLAAKRLKAYENRLSREKEIPALLESLSKLARDSRVKILGITPLQKVRASMGRIYQEVPISINAQSGYHELGNFINKLENDKRFMQISNLSVRANRNNAKWHNIRFVVYAYMFKGDS